MRWAGGAYPRFLLKCFSENVYFKSVESPLNWRLDLLRYVVFQIGTGRPSLQTIGLVHETVHALQEKRKE